MLPGFSFLRCRSLFRGLPKLCLSSSFGVYNNGFKSIAEFNKVADETLESLHEYFDELIEGVSGTNDNELKDGVLTVSFSPFDESLTYVINKQSINFQIWLSSPLSGPKRFDYIEEQDAWIYLRTKQVMHQMLELEIAELLQTEVDFSTCQHSGSLLFTDTCSRNLKIITSFWHKELKDRNRTVFHQDSRKKYNSK